MKLTKYILILALLLPISLIGQTKNQTDIAAQWKNGSYKKYQANDYGSFKNDGEEKFEFKKNSDNVVFEVVINGDRYGKWGKTGSTWVSGYDKSNYACLFFTDNGQSIVRYSLDASSNTVISAYAVYGEQLGKEKVLIKMINAYLKYGVDKMKTEIVESKNIEKENEQKYSINGQEVASLKIEIIAENKNLDVGSTFDVGYIVTKADGAVIKSENLGGKATSYNYKIKVSGADKGKDGLFKAKQYCEGYRNDALVITVIATGSNTITEKLTFDVNCVPDPAILAAKKKKEADRIQAEKEDVARAAAAKAKIESDKQKATAIAATKGDQVGVTITDDNTSFVKLFTKDFRKLNGKEAQMKEGLFQSLTHISTVKVDDKTLFLGSVVTSFEKKEIGPAIYDFSNNALTPLKLDLLDFPVLPEAAFRDVVKLSSSEILVASDGGLLKMTKTSTGYKTTKFLKSEESEPLYFTKIVSLGNGKCASIGYTAIKEGISGPPLFINRGVKSLDYKNDAKYKEFRDKGISHYDYNMPEYKFECKAYLVIWNHTNGQQVKIFLGDNVSEESILAVDSKGNLIYSLGRQPVMFSGFKGRDGGSYFTANNTINSLNVDKSFTSKELSYNWIADITTKDQNNEKISPVVTDLQIENNGNIVFAGIVRRVDQHYNNTYSKDEIFSSYVGLGRVTAQGGLQQIEVSTGLNQSLWGGSDKGELSINLMPGKVYYSEYGNPKLGLSPDGKGLILLHKGAYDKVEYPSGGFRNSDASIYTDSPLFVYIDKGTLTPVSFDLINTTIMTKASERGYTVKGYSRKDEAFNTYETNFFTYNSSTKKYKLIQTAKKMLITSYVWDFQPTFKSNWVASLPAKETISEENDIAKIKGVHNDYFEDLRAATDAEHNSSASSSSNSSNSSSSSSSSSSASVEMVKVSINTNGKGDAWVYIHWTVDGQNKKHTFAHNTSGSIGMIPAGTDLYYATEQTHSNSKRTLFYTVPEGKSSVSVKLD